MAKFNCGEIWTYQTRPGESASRVAILRVDTTDHAGVIVHVAVDALTIVDPAKPDQAIRSIGFMPLAEAALEASVTALERSDASFEPSADFEDGYRGWKEAFDSGKAGYWTAPVARVVQTIDDGLQR